MMVVGLAIGLSIPSVYAHQIIIFTPIVNFPPDTVATWNNSTASFTVQSGNFTAYIDGRLVAWSDGQLYWRIPATIVLTAETHNFTYAYKGFAGISDFVTIVPQTRTVITLTPTVATTLSSQQTQTTSVQPTTIQIDTLPIALAIVAAGSIIALSIVVSRRRK